MKLFEVNQYPPPFVRYIIIFFILSLKEDSGIEKQIKEQNLADCD